MSSTGTLSADPLFVGLTRPTLVLGVSTSFAMLNMMIFVVIFIQTSSFKILPLAFAIHMVGYILCFKEPRFMELYLNYSNKCKKCTNKSYYGANSYSL